MRLLPRRDPLRFHNHRPRYGRLHGCEFSKQMQVWPESAQGHSLPVARRRAGREVRSSPIADLIPTPWLIRPAKTPVGHFNQRPTFADVNRLIVLYDCPSWLPALLEWWAQGICHDWMADQYRLTTSQTAERLSEVVEALAVLERNLDDPTIRKLLEIAKLPNQIRLPKHTLRDVSERAEITQSSSILIGKDGKTKRGHGKPSVPDVFDAKTLCAARILELWRFLNKREPGIRSSNAAAAAQAYWLACGGISKGVGNPLNGWKHHFKIAKDQAGSIGLKLTSMGKAPNVRARQARPASSSPYRRYMTAAAPKLRQSQNWTPIRGQFWTPIDSHKV